VSAATLEEDAVDEVALARRRSTTASARDARARDDPDAAVDAARATTRPSSARFIVE
jgi:hypothetical protein